MELKKLYKRPYKENITKRVEMFCRQHQLIYTDLQVFNGYVTFVGYCKLPYNTIVNKLIAERYTIQDELAIQRKYQRGENTAEFDEYYTFVEECKTKAKEFIAERGAINE